MSCDLILLEVSQIEIAGLKVLEQIKSHERQQIPVLLMAAPDETARGCARIAMGAVDYFNQALFASPSDESYSLSEQTRLREQLVHYKGVVEEFREQKQPKQTSASNSKRYNLS